VEEEEDDPAPALGPSCRGACRICALEGGGGCGVVAVSIRAGFPVSVALVIVVDAVVVLVVESLDVDATLSLSPSLSCLRLLLAVFSSADPSGFSFVPVETGLARSGSSRPPPKYSLPIPFGRSPQRALAHLRLRARSSAPEAGATSAGLPAGMLLGNKAPRTLRSSGGRLAGSKTCRWML
jgi:hypothetical protein